MASDGKKFVIDVGGIDPELLKTPLSGKIKITGRTLTDSESKPTWALESYEANLDLTGSTVADLILCSFSTSAWVRYQAKARKCTKQEITGFLATPLLLTELLTRAERAAVDPVTAVLRKMDTMTAEEQFALIQMIQEKANAAKAAQARPTK